MAVDRRLVRVWAPDLAGIDAKGFGASRSASFKDYQHFSSFHSTSYDEHLGSWYRGRACRLACKASFRMQDPDLPDLPKWLLYFSRSALSFWGEHGQCLGAPDLLEQRKNGLGKSYQTTKTTTLCFVPPLVLS